MADENKVVDESSTAAAEILEKVMQLQKTHEGQVLQYQRQIRNLQQCIKDLGRTHAAELAKYTSVKSNVHIQQSTPELSKPTETSETLEEVIITDPLKLPEVMEMILSNLEDKALREVRSVCKLWNETWVRIISKQPSCVPLNENSIVKLNSVLLNSSAPEAIIQKILCKGSYGDDSKYEENLQEFLKRFGHKVKILDTKNEKIVFSPLKSILVNSGEWCQNLEELNINLGANAGNFQDCILKDGQLSRLKRLTFVYGYNNDESRVPGDKHLFSTLIKASSNLAYLKMDFSSQNIKVVAECVNTLTAYPEVTRNLKEFEIRGNWKNPEFNLFKNLLEVEFSSKLKALTLECTNPVLPKKEIAKLLKKVGGSLESLSIVVGPDHVYTEKLDWPVLPRLKYLKNFAQDELQFELVELKIKMPSLETLILAGSYEALFDMEYSERLINIEEPRRKFPHLGVKNLTIFDKMDSARAPAVINRMFPNISKLTIYIHPQCDDMERGSRWFLNAFEGLSQMKKITNLTLCLKNDCFNEYVNYAGLCMAFEKLKNLPDFRFLTLIDDNHGIVGSIFENLVFKLLSEFQGLQRLKLINFTTSASSVVECMKRKGPDTQLEFTDEPDFVDGFYEF